MLKKEGEIENFVWILQEMGRLWSLKFILKFLLKVNYYFRPFSYLKSFKSIIESMWKNCLFTIKYLYCLDSLKHIKFENWPSRTFSNRSMLVPKVYWSLKSKVFWSQKLEIQKQTSTVDPTLRSSLILSSLLRRSSLIGKAGKHLLTLCFELFL